MKKEETFRIAGSGFMILSALLILVLPLTFQSGVVIMGFGMVGGLFIGLADLVQQNNKKSKEWRRRT